MSRFSAAFDSRFGLRFGQSDYRTHDQTQPHPLKAIHKITYGAEGRTRTGTARATAPSRRRVYQFHHFGNRLFDLTADHGVKHDHDH